MGAAGTVFRSQWPYRRYTRRVNSPSIDKEDLGLHRLNMKTAVVSLDQPDSGVLDRVLAIQKAFVGITVLLCLPGLGTWAFPVFRNWLPNWAVVPVSAVLVALACAASLALSLSLIGRESGGLQHWVAGAAISLGVAASLTAGGVAALSRLLSLSDYPASRPGEMTVQIAVAFVLLGLLLLVLDAKRGPLSHAADLILAMLGVLTMFLTAHFIFEATNLFRTGLSDPTPAATLAALDLLTACAFLARMRYGFFDILLGSGMGGRIARQLTLLLIVLPFVREASRERLIRAHLVPEHGAAAILGAISSGLALLLLVLITRYIRRMEKSIRHLTLRDELTGLYNLRGFKLLAEQALRLAQRSNVPFSLLFIDVDDLKQINDSLGHGVGSAMLAETAEVLTASFREADVVGRIGGDEFAVAGQLDQRAIMEAVERLEAQASNTRSEASRSLPISLSIGHVTAHASTQETLDELLHKADVVMYNQKRRKKLQLC